MSLRTYGWNESWQTAFAPHAAEGLEPARIVCELRRNFYAVQTDDDELLGECGGKFFHLARTPDQFPAVGDWVAVQRRVGEPRADIHFVLPRRTKFSRRAAGDEQIEQIVAANIDTVFLVSGLDRNYNPARIQRFLVAARESGAEPVVVLNKADLHPDADAVRREIEALVPEVPVLTTNTTSRRGLQALRPFATRGRTLAFIGSSGVGKSSLINVLLRDEALPTGDVREKDSKGRHTTTRRELVRTPSGALLIDTPGMRELQLWGIDEGIADAFPDVAELARQCRFTDCGHGNEPGCAVRAAVTDGRLPASRLASYLKLKSEQVAAQPTRAESRPPAAKSNRTKWRKLNAERDAWRKHLDD